MYHPPGQGLDFDAAWLNRITHDIGTMQIPFLNRLDLVRNKKATGRARDLADLEMLEANEE